MYKLTDSLSKSPVLPLGLLSLCLLSLCLLILQPLSAHGEDIPYATIKSNKKLSWKIYSTASQESSTISGSFGESGDHVIYGHLIDAGVDSIGVITTKESKKTVTWKIIDLSGNIVKQLTLGKKKDLFVVGGDFNGNGIIDPIVVSTVGSSLRWKIYFDYFSNTQGGIKKVKFGKATQRDSVFFMNYDGQNDWLGVVQNKKGNKDRVRLKNISSGASKSFLAYKAAASSANTPLAVRASDGSDYVAIPRKVGKNTVVRVQKGAALLAQYQFPGTDTLISGDFLSDYPGDEIAIKSGAKLIVLNPESLFESSLDDFPKSGIPIDRININSFVKSKKKKDAGAGDGGGDGSPTSCDQTFSPYDGSEGFLWKPESESNGKLVVLLPKGYVPASVKLVYENNELQILSFAGIANGDRAHYRDPNYSGSHYPSGVVVRGSSGGKTRCWVIDKPGDRID